MPAQGPPVLLKSRHFFKAGFAGSLSVEMKNLSFLAQGLNLQCNLNSQSKGAGGGPWFSALGRRIAMNMDIF